MASARETFVDRLSSRYTVYLLLLLATIITLVMLFGERNQCWTPAHYADSHVDFSHSVSVKFTSLKYFCFSTNCCPKVTKLATTS